MQKPRDYPRNIAELPQYPGDIYVVGAGKSLDYINKSFFAGKVTIGINIVHRFVPVTYCLAQHTSLIREMIGRTIPIASEYDMAMHTRPRYDSPESDLRGVPLDYYIFEHSHNYLYDYSDKHRGYLDLDFSNFDYPNGLVCGGTTTEAIHLAYQLGATNIILVGIDGCLIDGEPNVSGYPEPTEVEHIFEMQPQIDKLCNEIRRRGVGVYSLNPFTTVFCENHVITL